MGNSTSQPQSGQTIPITPTQTIPNAHDKTIPITPNNQPQSDKTIPITLDISEETIKCEINIMFTDLQNAGKGSCILSTDNNTYITIYNFNNDTYNDKWLSLIKYFTSSEKNKVTMPGDLKRENTLWIEYLSNSSNKRGFGKKLLQSVVNKAQMHNYKYVFLYPSAGLTNTKVTCVDQNRLIDIYKSYGFKQLPNCKFCVDGDFYENNIFDNDACYHLMFGSIDELTLDNKYSKIQVDYQSKYIKYKTK